MGGGGAVLLEKDVVRISVRIRIRRSGREVERKRKKGMKYNKKRKCFFFI